MGVGEGNSSLPLPQLECTDECGVIEMKMLTVRSVYSQLSSV